MRITAKLLAALLSLTPALVYACPTCKDAFELDPGAQGFGRGIYYSVLFMLGMLALMATFIIRMIKREGQMSDAMLARDREAPPSSGA